MSDVPAIDDLFRAMCALNASDLHLCVGSPPMIRKDGRMQPLDPAASALTAEGVEALFAPITPEKNRKEFAERHDTDFAYEVADLARFRANAFADRKGPGAVFRVIPSTIITVEQLGLSPHILQLCQLNKGLVLVTGPTGSGKSTTLCAMVDYINRTRHDHIITIEDPIEFVHPNKQCLINQREVRTHTGSFKDALRAASARTRTSCWSGRCETWRLLPSRLKPLKRGIWSSAPSTRRLPRRRSIASSISFRQIGRSRSA